MSFNNLVLSTIEERISSRTALAGIVAEIGSAAKKGKIAFYPCSRCTSDLLGLLRQSDPDAMANVVGCFDRAADAFAAEGVPVYPLEELPRFAPGLETVIVTANVFYARELSTVAVLVGDACRLVPVSGIDLELGRLDPDSLMQDIRDVYDLLVDEKSRVDYLLAWLARLLNDETLTQVFASDVPAVSMESDGSVFYKQYRLDYLPPEIVRELHLNVYSLGEVVVEKGDTVLDVGAFKGDTAVCFADLVGTDGKVYSFEPVRANYNDLVHNVQHNGLDTVVHVVNKGCGSAAGRVRVATAPQGSPWAFLSPERGVEEIDLISIDEFVAGVGLERVDFIKLDVEGVERDVLQGAIRTIATHRSKLAVSLYHNLVDLTALPLLIHSLADYDLRIRCRMEGPWSIFLYAAPRRLRTAEA